MEHKINVLMTGAGAPGGPGIIKCILENQKRYKLFISDADDNASGKYLIPSRFHKIPLANDASPVIPMLPPRVKLEFSEICFCLLISKKRYPLYG